MIIGTPLAAALLASALLAATHLAATPLAPMDDDSPLMWEGAGEDAGERYGAAVDTAGDFDGDAFEDVVIGIPGRDGKRKQDVGAAIVVSGRTGEILATLSGVTSGAGFGHAVAGVGDVNADGFDDVAVGAPLTDDGRGAVHVFLGHKGKTRVVLKGSQKGEHFGWSVAGAGDVDQDGMYDIVVGAPEHGGDAGESAGRVLVASGKSKGKKLKQLAEWFGETAGAHFGWSVTRTEDIFRDLEDEEARDNNRDVIVGAPGGRATSDGPQVGIVYVYEGRTAELIRTLQGRGNGDRFGAVVRGGGDMNGDGYGDVVVAEDAAPGRVVVHSGKTGRAMRRLTPDNSTQAFGASLGAGGDVDGDGYDDIVVGLPGDTSSKGAGDNQHPSVRVYSGKTGKLVLEIPGTSVEDGFGLAVAIAGDMDNDGFDEIIVGADERGVRAGFARAFTAN